jgi:uncharacterized membrane protein YfcA
MPLLPPDITVFDAALLIAISTVTSAVSAAFSIGGGVAFLAVLASIVPPAAVIPLHGVVQVGSNLVRAIIQRDHIMWHIVGPFVGGSVVGAVIGGQIVFQLPGDVLRIVLAVFILYATWGPMRFRMARGGKLLSVITGVCSSFMTMFIGATGPFVSSVFGPMFPDRLVFVATHGACMLFQHAIKIVVFAFLGFAFVPWAPLLAGILAAGVVGTMVGTRLLGQMEEAFFRKVIRIALTILALNLLAIAFGLYS